MSMSQSTGNSSSSSVTTPIQTPENDIINQISGVASGLANQMLSWANGVFAQTSQITNEAVGNFFQVSQKMAGLSDNMTGQYNNLFAPENAQLVADANSYNSVARQQTDMGMAGATQANAGTAALQSSEAALQSYGINPADGRYAALDKAAAVQNAANVAGAENMQRDRDVQTGQQLRQAAVNVGAQLPAAIANVNNTAIQANTGASNASLANANTGANLMKLPNDYLGTAMQVKMPFQGTQGSSTSHNQSTGADNKPAQSGQGAGAGNGAGGAGNGTSPSNMNPSLYTQNGSPGGGAVGRGNPNAGIMHLPGDGAINTGDYSDPTGQNYDPMSSIDPGSFGDGNTYQPGGQMGVGAQTEDNIFNNSSGSGTGDSNPFSDSGFGQQLPSDQFGGADQTVGGMGGGTDTQYGNISYDTAANNATPDATAGFGDYSQPSEDTDWGSGAGGGGGDDYAGGGAIPMHGSSRTAWRGPRNNFMADGGQVPAAMSPSGGQQVDDVQAKGPGGSNINLNTDEFVIPRDVALWKGQEFFQNLIDQSRKKRVMAPAQGGKPASASPPMQNQPAQQMMGQ